MIWSLQSSPELTDVQFEQWSKLLEERAGIHLSHQQRVFLQTQVAMRMREVGHTDYTQYFHRVNDGVSGVMEWSVLVDRLVVKETSFYRHPPSVDFVRDSLQERVQQKKLDGSYDAWSVGCSSGEEAYTLAMVMNDCYESANLDAYFSITATDISRPALQIAKTGVYPRRKVDMLGGHFRHTYFSETENDRFQIDQALCRRIGFHNANVLNINQMPRLQFDVIFCQNVLIYFRQALRHKVVDSFVERLKPGGILVLGLGEVSNWNNPSVGRVARDELQAYCIKQD